MAAAATPVLLAVLQIAAVRRAVDAARRADVLFYDVALVEVVVRVAQAAPVAARPGPHVAVVAPA